MNAKDLKLASPEQIKEKIVAEGAGFLTELELKDVLEILVAKKVWNIIIEAAIIKSVKEAEMAIQIMIASNFVPTVTLASRMLDESKNEDLLVKIVKLLNNFPFPTENLLQANNKRQSKLFFTLWVACPKARDPRLLVQYARLEVPEFENIIAEAIIESGDPGSELCKAVVLSLSWRKSLTAALGGALAQVGAYLDDRGYRSTFMSKGDEIKFDGTLRVASRIGIVKRFLDSSIKYEDGIDDEVGPELLRKLNPKSVPKSSLLFDLFNPPQSGPHEFNTQMILLASRLIRNGVSKHIAGSYLKSYLVYGKYSDAFANSMMLYVPEFISGKRNLEIDFTKIQDRDEKLNALKGVRNCDPLVTRLKTKEEKETTAGVKKVFFTEMLEAFWNGFAEMEAVEKSTGYTIEKFVTDSHQSTKSVDTLYRGHIKKAFPINKLHVFDSANAHIRRKIADKLSDKIEISDAIYKKSMSIIDQSNTSTQSLILSESSLLDLFAKELDSLLRAIEIRTKKKLETGLLVKGALAQIKAGKAKSADFLSLSNIEDAGIFLHLTAKEIKKVASDLKYNEATTMVTITDKDGELVFSDEDLKEHLTSSTGRLDVLMLRVIKKNRKALYLKVKEAYVKKDKSFFGGKLTQERDVLESEFSIVKEAKEKKESSNPERSSLMSRIRAGKYMRESDVPLLRDIYEEKPQYFDDKELHLSEEAAEKLIGFTKKKTIKVWSVKTARQLEHFIAERTDLNNDEKIKAVIMGIGSGIGHIYFDNAMLDNQETVDAMLSARQIQLSQIKEGNFDKMTEKQFLLLVGNLSRIPIGKIKVDSYHLNDLTEALIALYKKSLDLKINVDNSMIRRIEFVHKASGVELEHLDDLIGDLGIENNILTGAKFERVVIPGVYLRTSFIAFMETLDPRFKGLSLGKLNLDSIEDIGTYEEFLESSGMTLETIEKFVEIPASVKTNPKSLRTITSLIAMDGNILLRKAKALNHLFNAKVSADDVLQIDFQGEVEMSDWFARLDIKSLVVLADAKDSVLKDVFTGKSHKEVRHLINTSMDGNNLRDAIGMFKAAKNKLADLKDQENKDKNGKSLPEIQKLIKALEDKFEKAIKRDDMNDIHDLMASIANSLDGSPLDPTGLDRYQDVAGNEIVTTVTGASPERLKGLKLTEKGRAFLAEPMRMKLFFPKNKSDLINLGADHDWCVDTMGEYYEETVRGNSVLVALCEGHASIDNARFLTELYIAKDGEVTISQVRLSQKLGDVLKDVSDLIDRRVLVDVIFQAKRQLDEIEAEKQLKLALKEQKKAKKTS